MDGSVTDNKKQIKWLDALKGIACWMVFLGHFEEDYPYVPGLQKLYEAVPVIKFISEKTTALNIFYIVSAFLVANRFLNSPDNNASKAGKSVLKRYLRLSIPVFVTNLLIILIQRMGYGFGNRYGMFASRYTFGEAVWNAFVDGMFFGSTYFNSNMWMLNELFLGYLFTVVVCLVLNEMKPVAGNIMLIIMTAVLWISGCYLAVFFFGIILYRIVNDGISEKPVLSSVLGTGLLILGCIVSSYNRIIVLKIPSSVPELPLRTWWSYCWIAAMLMVAGIALNPYLIRILEWGPLHKLGRICFPVFLFHRIYLASFAALAYSYGFARNSDKGEGSLAAFAVSFSLTLISSLIYAILLEPPINKLTEKILSRVFIKKKAV